MDPAVRWMDFEFAGGGALRCSTAVSPAAKSWETRPSSTYSTLKISTTVSTTPGPQARAATSSVIPCFPTTSPGNRPLSHVPHGSTTSRPSPSLTPRPSPFSLPSDLRQYHRRGRTSGRRSHRAALRGITRPHRDRHHQFLPAPRAGLHHQARRQAKVSAFRLRRLHHSRSASADCHLAFRNGKDVAHSGGRRLLGCVRTEGETSISSRLRSHREGHPPFGGGSETF